MIAVRSLLSYGGRIQHSGFSLPSGVDDDSSSSLRKAARSSGTLVRLMEDRAARIDEVGDVCTFGELIGGEATESSDGDGDD